MYRESRIGNSIVLHYNSRAIIVCRSIGEIRLSLMALFFSKDSVQVRATSLLCIGSI